MPAVAVDVSRYVARASGFDAWKVQASEVSGIRVFDVGQGDCIGLVGLDGNVVGYIDYGGLADHPDRDTPHQTAVRLPVHHGKAQAPIILTHWDKDHWWSAQHKNPKARKVPWLVPRQWVGPSTARFASELRQPACWPERWGTRPVRFSFGKSSELEIRKTAPYDASSPHQDRNHSGLVVLLIIQKDIGTWSALLPGDCPFDWIPRSTTPITALVAYHHGSGVGATPEEFSRWITADTRVMFSFGRNSYGHPQRQNYRGSLLPFLETPSCRSSGLTHHEVTISPA